MATMTALDSGPEPEEPGFSGPVRIKRRIGVIIIGIRVLWTVGTVDRAVSARRGRAQVIASGGYWVGAGTT